MSRMHAGMPLVVLVALSIAGCGAVTPIDHRVGEIHLHQYASGAHLEVLFIDPPTPIARTEFDSTLPTLVTPLYDDGTCKVFPAQSCTSCTPPNPVDGGAVHIGGLPMPLDLRFHAESFGYDEAVPTGDFLVAGAHATIAGDGTTSGVKIPPFSAELTIPPRIDPVSTLDSGLAGGFEATWQPSGQALSVRILLSVTPTGATTAIGASVSCFVEDELGRFAVPAAALALLPPAPRQNQLEISRNRLVDVSLGDGRGVVIHGGYSLLTAKNE